ncbi:MAG: LptF/LptG family permease [Planctomycetes bacterium]|nr:LptF/LptG family permease [Planctomycetota bacterium]
MKILDKYILRTFLTTAGMVFLVLISLRIVVDLFVNMDEFLKQENVVGDIVSYYGHQTLVYLIQLGGVIIVAAAAFSLARMNYTNELTAMLASGVSMHRVVWPIILCSMGLCAIIVANQELLVPRLVDKLVRDPDNVPGTKKFQLLFMNDSADSLWYAGECDPTEQTLNPTNDPNKDNVWIVLRDKNLEYSGLISGKKAVVSRYDRMSGWMLYGARISAKSWPNMPDTSGVFTRAGPDEFLKAAGKEVNGDLSAKANLTVEFPPIIEDGSSGLSIAVDSFWTAPPGPGEPRPGALKGNVEFQFTSPEGRIIGIFLADSAKWVEAGAYDSKWELANGRLFVPTDLGVNDMAIRRSGRWLDYMSTPQLTALLRMGKLANPDAVVLMRYIRMTDPINNLIMLLLGLPFILSRERNIKASAGLCVLIVLSFYCFIYVCRYIGLPPVWAAWLPILIFGPVAAVMLDSVKT